MSPSNFNYYRYGLFLGLPILVLFTFLLIMSFKLQPIRGDLTRIGGFSENYYGWHSEQLSFDKSPIDYIGNLSEITHPYDVIILGDSFTAGSRTTGWHNYVTEATGLSIAVIHISMSRPQDIMEHPVIKANPPKLFIYQSVERILYGRATRFEGDCKAQAFTPKSTEVKPDNRVIKTTRPLDLQPDRFNLNLPAQWLRAKLNPFNHVVERPLDRDDLFSSFSANRLLFHDQDFDKYALKSKAYKNITCGLINLQNEIQRNGDTMFLFLPAPDKSSVYGEYILDEKRQYNTLLDDIASDDIRMIPSYTLLKDAVSGGAVDIYLPDDTHWGAAGHQLIADAVIDKLYESSFFHGNMVIDETSDDEDSEAAPVTNDEADDGN